MRYPTIFNLISEVFKRANVPCVLIGGFAVTLHKAERNTRDIDFLIAGDSIVKILPLFEAEGYKKGITEKIFIRLEDSGQYGVPIDLMFVDKDTLDKIISDGKKIEIAGETFVIPSLYDLIALKVHSIRYNADRELKDLFDIVKLIRANDIDVKEKKFKEICLKYGTAELYSKILTHCKRE